MLREPSLWGSVFGSVRCVNWENGSLNLRVSMLHEHNHAPSTEHASPVFSCSSVRIRGVLFKAELNLPKYQTQLWPELVSFQDGSSRKWPNSPFTTVTWPGLWERRTLQLCHRLPCPDGSCDFLQHLKKSEDMRACWSRTWKPSHPTSPTIMWPSPKSATLPVQMPSTFFGTLWTATSLGLDSSSAWAFWHCGIGALTR